MLYPKNDSPRLDEKLYRNPTSEYRGTPFWAWNCELDENELTRQLEVFKEMGLGGAHMHVRTGMGTPYLGNEFMRCIHACVEKCRKENMLAWLYDEDRWPSGMAGGLVTKDPACRLRHLLFTTHPYGTVELDTGDENRFRRSDNGYLLACYDILLNEDGSLAGVTRIGENEQAQGTKWYAYVETDPAHPRFNGYTYVNTLDKKAIERFIEVTHEAYKREIGKDFGGVVPAIFTDEPQFNRKGTLGFADDTKDVLLPWTDDLPETFREACGEDIVAHLPELFWELPDGKLSTVRYHYHDHICDRFTCAFSDTIGAWCGKNGIMFTGHMMAEETLDSQTGALGEAMRSYRAFQLPGIDMLCDRFEYTTAKQTQSAVHQFGRQGMLSELYGVTGWTSDFRLYKLLGDWQAALGVTVRVQHLAWLSMKGNAKRDYPASINYQSPWWHDYRYVEDHYARLNTVLTRGKPVVKIGVIHPIESYWLHWGPASVTKGVRDEMDERFKSLTDWLIHGGTDFDFISESLLPEQCAEGGAPLTVGEMRYDTIIVPACETMRSSTYERLEKFKAAGGKLIILGKAPTLENAVPSARGLALAEGIALTEFSRNSVLEALKDDRILDVRTADGIRTNNLVSQMRDDGDTRWLFLAHSRKPRNPDIPIRQDLRITVSGEYSAVIYDTVNGTQVPAKFAVRNGKTVISAVLYDYDSLLLRLEAPGTYESAETVTVTVVFDALENTVKDNHLILPKVVDFALSEPNVLLLDKAEYALDDEDWRPEKEILRADTDLRRALNWRIRASDIIQPWAVAPEPITHKIRLRFTIQSEIAVSGTKLALEDGDKARIVLNGAEVTSPVDGWYVDKCILTRALPELQAGTNILEVELPLGKRTDPEWCYLLGDFGVSFAGGIRTLVNIPKTLGFGSVTQQLLGHYTGNITYKLNIPAHGGKLHLQIPHFAGTAIRVKLDGEDRGLIAYSPYALDLGTPAEGKHALELTLLGNRENGFGPLHMSDKAEVWIGPGAWLTRGTKWSESYALKPLGILSAPWIWED